MLSTAKLLLAAAALLIAEAPVQAETGGLLGIKKSQVCSGLMTGIAQYHLHAKASNELTANVIADLRGFRLSLSQETFHPKAQKLSLTSTKLSGSGRKDLVSQITGIEKMWYEPDTSNAAMENVIVGVKLTGRKQIQEFYNDLQEIIVTVNKLTNDHSRVVGKLTRIGQSLLATMVGGAGIYFHSGMTAPLLSLALLVTTEPTSLLSYSLSSDKAFNKSVVRMNDFLAKPESGKFIFDSFDYKLDQAVINGVYKKGLADSETRLWIQSQDNKDSRGIFYRLYRPYYLKRHYPKEWAQIKANETKGWVGLDRLLRYNDQGEPEMLLVMRTRAKRPEYPKTVPVKEEKLSPKLVPSLVTVPR